MKTLDCAQSPITARVELTANPAVENTGMTAVAEAMVPLRDTGCPIGMRTVTASLMGEAAGAAPVIAAGAAGRERRTGAFVTLQECVEVVLVASAA